MSEPTVTTAHLLNAPVSEVDPEVDAAMKQELHRQQSTLEMIASENFTPVAVMQAQGSVLTNKYAEGYPGKRYYGGCEYVDVIEQLAIDRVKALFGAGFANVQPHSGASANTAVYFALLQPGDTILGLDLAHGGHLTHGMRINYSRQDAQRRRLPREQGRLPGRHGRGRVARARTPAQDDRGRLVGVLPPARLRPLPGHRRRGRRLALRRHGALRRPGRDRPAPLADRARARRHDDDPQDARRPARWRDPHQRRRHRQEDQLGRLPRHAGWPARARHRGQGGQLPGRGRAGVRRPAAPHRQPGRRRWPRGCPSRTSRRPASAC